MSSAPNFQSRHFDLSDPVTLDRLFTLHFEDHPPIHVAVGALDLTAILADMHKVAASAMN